MKNYKVRVENDETKESEWVQVEALDEWKARTRAMMKTSVKMNGALANYIVLEVFWCQSAGKWVTIPE